MQAIKAKYGEKVWNQVRKKSGIPHKDFNVHKSYSETVFIRLTKAAVEVTGATREEIMDLFGESFVSFVGQYGYDRILRVLGRNLRDFLNGLDNLHEYLRFSYPRLKPPSFFVEDEGADGLTLHYRTRRKGYLYYVMGQIRAVSRQLYDTEIEIEVLQQDEGLDSVRVIMRLHFDNTAFAAAQTAAPDTNNKDIDINSAVFFEVFPFHVVFDRNMIIQNMGTGLEVIMGNVVGSSVDEVFQMTRPLVEFSIENVSALLLRFVSSVSTLSTLKLTALSYCWAEYMLCVTARGKRTYCTCSTQDYETVSSDRLMTFTAQIKVPRTSASMQ